MADSAAPAKNTGLFYAYIALYTKDTSRWSDMVTLTFANVDAADKWWELVTGNAAKWPSDFNMTKDNLQRHGPQWFSWPVPNDSKNVLRKVEVDPAMEAVRGQWAYKVTQTARDDYPAHPTIPMQDAAGWPVRDPADAAAEAMQASLAEISETLKNMPAAQGAGAVAARGGGNWVDGASGPGGYASYQIVEDAYAKAKQLKDSGDNRSFGMIFAQLSMEMRRKV